MSSGETLNFRGGFVSRARCGILHAAPQNRDRTECRRLVRPRISSAPRREVRRAAQHPGNASGDTITPPCAARSSCSCAASPPWTDRAPPAGSARTAGRSGNSARADRRIRRHIARAAHDLGQAVGWNFEQLRQGRADSPSGTRYSSRKTSPGWVWSRGMTSP
jgi:hypothetical protein